MLAAIAHGEYAFQQAVPALPLDRIVVGIDFSRVSLAAAQWVGRHLARDAALTLVHVIEPPPLPNVLQLRSARMPDAESRLRARIESLRGALHGLSGVLGGTDTRVEVRVGDPALQLSAYADLVEADLVVVGGNAVSRAAPRRETATTDRLLRHLSRPGLVARNVQAAPTTVLAALDGDAAASVLTVARMVAAPCAARVATLGLADTTPFGSLERRAHLLRETGVLVKTPDAVVKREQVRMIIDVARKLRAEVIVIGSHVSATEDDDDAANMLARTANCSVLVVPHAAEPRPRRAHHLDVMAHVQRCRSADSQYGGTGPTRPAASLCGKGDAA
jgi:nucleotide-binding universal stress UspA family protein